MLTEKQEARRAEILEYLGGECGCCGTKTRLEIDHIDPADRRDNKSMLSKDLDRDKQEFDACQLLCVRCHGSKSTRDRYHGRFSRLTKLKHRFGSKPVDTERRAYVDSVARPYVKAFFVPR